MAPLSSIGWIFYGKNRLCWDCFLYQNSVDLKYAKNALAVGAPPQTPLGELTVPRGVGIGDNPSPIPTPLGGFGASILAPSALSFCAPNVKSWLRPW